VQGGEALGSSSSACQTCAPSRSLAGFFHSQLGVVVTRGAGDLAAHDGVSVQGVVLHDDASSVRLWWIPTCAEQDVDGVGAIGALAVERIALDHDVVRGADDDATWARPVRLPAVVAEDVVPHASPVGFGPAAGHLPLDGVIPIVLEEVVVDIPGPVLAMVAPDPVPPLIVDVGVCQGKAAIARSVGRSDLDAGRVSPSLRHRPGAAVLPAVHVVHY